MMAAFLFLTKNSSLRSGASVRCDTAGVEVQRCCTVTVINPDAVNMRGTDESPLTVRERCGAVLMQLQLAVALVCIVDGDIVAVCRTRRGSCGRAVIRIVGNHSVHITGTATVYQIKVLCQQREIDRSM